MDSVQTVGEKVRSDRIAMGLSLRQLAKKLEISISTLQRIETDETSPSLALLQKIADQLHQPVLVFFKVKGK